MVLHPKAQATLDRWHQMVAGADLSEVKLVRSRCRIPFAGGVHALLRVEDGRSFLQQAVQALGDFRQGGDGTKKQGKY